MGAGVSTRPTTSAKTPSCHSAVRLWDEAKALPCFWMTSRRLSESAIMPCSFRNDQYSAGDAAVRLGEPCWRAPTVAVPKEMDTASLRAIDPYKGV